MAKSTFKKKNGVLSEASEEILSEETTEVVETEEAVEDNSDNDINETEVNDETEADNSDNDELNSVFNPTSTNDFTPFEPELEKEARVKIRLNEDYRGCIGGTRYYFEKDGVYLVDENVKRILNKSGLLKPLS